MYIWQQARLAAVPAGHGPARADRLPARATSRGSCWAGWRRWAPKCGPRPLLRTLTDDIVKSGGIEGRTLAPDRVRAAIADRLDPDDTGPPARGGHVEGLVEIALDAARDFAAPLTGERLFAWHAALYPTGWSRMRRIRTGAWRDDADGPMEIVSGPAGPRAGPLCRPAGRARRRRDGGLPRLVRGRAGHRAPYSPPESRISASSRSTRSTTATSPSRAR